MPFIARRAGYHCAPLQVNTFRGKYGALPGDIQQTLVTQFGFTAAATRAGTQCRGDGNGLIQPWIYGAAIPGYTYSVGGENAFFWKDLSTNSGLIEGGFNYSSDAAYTTTLMGSSVALVLPPTKVGDNNYISVYALNSQNYFEITSITSITSSGNASNASVGIAVQNAFAIDTKIDDGKPQSGNVLALYTSSSLNGITWAGGSYGSTPYTTATQGSATTCFDNGNVAGATQQYSVEQNNGTGVNCALSFRFQ